MNQPSDETKFWRKCTTCKKPIQFGQKYWICSVSTCNRVRTDLVFCDLRCFDAHVPVMNHRDAGAFEKKAPLTAASGSIATSIKSVEEKSRPKGLQQAPLSPTSNDEILVVVSKVKAYIKSRAGMNTSDSVAKLLTSHIIQMANLAIENAKKSGRQTVLDRDLLNHR